MFHKIYSDFGGFQHSGLFDLLNNICYNASNGGCAMIMGMLLVFILSIYVIYILMDGVFTGWRKTKGWRERRQEIKARRRMEKQWRPIKRNGGKVFWRDLSRWFENEPFRRIWTCPTCGKWNDPFTIGYLLPFEGESKDQAASQAAYLELGVCRNCLKECSLDFNYYHRRWDVGKRYSGEEPSLLGRTIYWNVLTSPPIYEGTSAPPKTKEKREVVIEAKRVVKL